MRTCHLDVGGDLVPVDSVLGVAGEHAGVGGARGLDDQSAWGAGVGGEREALINNHGAKRTWMKR